MPPRSAAWHGAARSGSAVIGRRPARDQGRRTVLRSALHSAVRQELIERNVAQLVEIPKQRKRKLVALTSEEGEARRFLESARSSSDPLYAAYVLVLVLGLRKGEVLGLA
jgi:integrase